MNTVKKTKNGRVELLRFLFSMGILLFHIQKRFSPEGIRIFPHGYIGVEFFFLVSGFLLAASAFAKKDLSTEAIGAETVKVVFGKIKKIFPYHIFAMILTIAVNAYFLEKTALDRFTYVVDSWASVLFLQVFGFDSTWVNKLTWYLDVWLMVTFIFWYFLRKHFDTFVNIVCPIIGLFVLGYLAHEYGSIAGIDEWTGHFYKCFLRGFGEMALGCSAFSLTRYIDRQEYSLGKKRLLAVVEAAGYLLTLAYALTVMPTKYSFPVVLVLWASVSLSFSKVNACEEFFGKSVFGRLGQVSLTIYLNQFFAIRLVQSLMPDQVFWVKAVLCVCLTVVTAFACEGFVRFVKDRIARR